MKCKSANRSEAPVQMCKGGGKRDGVARGYAGMGELLRSKCRRVGGEAAWGHESRARGPEGTRTRSTNERLRGSVDQNEAALVDPLPSGPVGK